MAYTTINKSTEHFNTKLYTGNGSTQSITGVGFQPDLVWFKSRTTTNNHALFDVVRGATKWLESNSTDAEQTYAGGLTSFDSDGFSVGNGSDVNLNSSSQVAWNWKAAGSTASNSSGSVTSTVSANTTAGFSICSFTQANSGPITIGHGLGVAPDMIIGKSRGNTSNWQIYHKSLGTGKFIQLNSTAAEQTVANFWGTVNTSIFTIGSNQIEANQPSVYYCFAEKTGYSKFGSYTGNNNQDGPFIYTGFKPAFVLFKRSSAVENWSLYDNKRANEYNPTAYGLRPNINNAESAYGAGGAAGGIDILSNGFKIREGGTNINDGTYIYMAFGQSLVGSNNVPCTAR